MKKYILVLSFTTVLFASDNQGFRNTGIPFSQQDILGVQINERNNFFDIKRDQNAHGAVTYNGQIMPELVWHRYESDNNIYKTFVYVCDGNELIASPERLISADIYARARQMALRYQNDQR